jgi:hypothetical protein
MKPEVYVFVSENVPTAFPLHVYTCVAVDWHEVTFVKPSTLVADLVVC